jgi:4-hydroxy 2-oxovalerate aldolase
MKKIKILDCTCRDGGYYNLWNFKISEINKYLLSCSRAGIDIVEVGFVFPKKKK